MRNPPSGQVPVLVHTQKKKKKMPALLFICPKQVTLTLFTEKKLLGVERYE